MGDGGAAPCEGGDLAVGEVEAMAEDGAFGEESCAVVDVGVVLGAGKEAGDGFDFGVVFGEVGLDVGAVSIGEDGGLAHECGGAGDGKTWADGVVEEAVVGAVPALEEVGGFAEGEGAGGIGWEVAVGADIHHDFSQGDPQSGAFGGGEGEVAGIFPDGAVEDGGGGAGGGEFGEKGADDREGFFAAESALEGKDVPVEPGEEAVFGAGDGGVLREVGVGIDEARGDDRAGVFGEIFGGEVGVAPNFEEGADIRDGAGLDIEGEGAVGDRAEVAELGGVEEVGAEEHGGNFQRPTFNAPLSKGAAWEADRGRGEI